MTTAHSFMRTRAFKLVAGLCVVSALAFLLGQSVAAYRARLAHEPTANAGPPIVRVAGAQGKSSVSRSSGGAPARVGQVTSAVTVAMRSQPTPTDQGRGHKQHHNHSHQSDKNAAGDGSHGGISHQSGYDQGKKGHGNDQGQGSHSHGD